MATADPQAPRRATQWLRFALARVLIAPIRLYQWYISPLLPPSCRYWPSCSSYAVTAIERHGPWRGTGLAIARVARCHPWAPGGIDPVPARPDSRPPDFDEMPHG